MKSEQVQKLMAERPFVPFTLHLPEGRSLRVFHHDFAWVAPDNRTFFVYQSVDGGASMIDLMLVASIDVDPIARPDLPLDEPAAPLANTP